MAVLPRRRVLTAVATGLAAAAAAGCTGRVGAPAASPSPTAPPPDPLLAELADEVRLLAAYDATSARHPGLRRRLAGPRADHTAHAAALERALDAAGSRPTPSATTPAARVPGTPAAALAGLRAAERAAARARTAAALVAPAGRAGLLAGVAASEATHVLVLR